MKVVDKSLLLNLQAYKDTVKTQNKNAQSSDSQKVSLTSSKDDSVKLSPQARQMQTNGIILRSIPDVREEKVSAIKAQIDSGAYEIDTEKMADKILVDIITNDFLE